jgi:hypothetical protein
MDCNEGKSLKPEVPEPQRSKAQDKSLFVSDGTQLVVT